METARTHKRMKPFLCIYIMKCSFDPEYSSLLFIFTLFLFPVSYISRMGD